MTLVRCCPQTALDIPRGEKAKHQERSLLGVVGDSYFMHAHHCPGSHRRLESYCRGR